MIPYATTITFCLYQGNLHYILEIWSKQTILDYVLSIRVRKLDRNRDLNKIQEQSKGADLTKTDEKSEDIDLKNR